MRSLGGPRWGKEMRVPLALALVVMAVAAWKVRHPSYRIPEYQYLCTYSSRRYDTPDFFSVVVISRKTAAAAVVSRV